MTTIKSYTDLEQSKKLTEILPLESADMMYQEYETVIGDDYGHDYRIQPFLSSDIDGIPCWSLVALLGVLPNPYIEQNYKGKWTCRVEHRNTTYLWEDSNPIDACVAMVEKLQELKLL